jgi:hypothetical protein
MKIVTWIDERGWKRLSMVREIDDERDAPEMGVPCGPPDLNLLDWDAIIRDLNNDLVERGLATWRDVQRNQNAVGSAVRRVITKRIIALYRNMEVQDGI